VSHASVRGCTRALPPPGAGRHAILTLERAAERRLRFVADLLGDADHVEAAGAEEVLIGDTYDDARMQSEECDATGRIVKVRGLPGAIARLRRALA